MSSKNSTLGLIFTGDNTRSASNCEYDSRSPYTENESQLSQWKNQVIRNWLAVPTDVMSFIPVRINTICPFWKLQQP